MADLHFGFLLLALKPNFSSQLKAKKKSERQLMLRKNPLAGTLISQGTTVSRFSLF